MSRIYTAARTVQVNRSLLKLVLLAAGLLAIAVGGGAPDCLPGTGSPNC